MSKIKAQACSKGRAVRKNALTSFLLLPPGWGTTLAAFACCGFLFNIAYSPRPGYGRRTLRTVTFRPVAQACTDPYGPGNGTIYTPFPWPSSPFTSALLHRHLCLHSALLLGVPAGTFRGLWRFALVLLWSVDRVRGFFAAGKINILRQQFLIKDYFTNKNNIDKKILPSTKKYLAIFDKI